MVNDILSIIIVLLIFIPVCFCICYYCFLDYRDNKKFRERVILLLSDIRSSLYCYCGGDVLEEGQD